jgi:hypothetical protein
LKFEILDLKLDNECLRARNYFLKLRSEGEAFRNQAEELRLEGGDL